MLHPPVAAPVLHHAAQLLHGGIGFVYCSEQQHTTAQLIDHHSPYPLELIYGLLGVDATLRNNCAVLGTIMSSGFFMLVILVVPACLNDMSAPVDRLQRAFLATGHCLGLSGALVELAFDARIIYRSE